MRCLAYFKSKRKDKLLTEKKWRLPVMDMNGLATCINGPTVSAESKSPGNLPGVTFMNFYVTPANQYHPLHDM
jgi:hypothetical protein